MLIHRQHRIANADLYWIDDRPVMKIHDINDSVHKFHTLTSNRYDYEYGDLILVVFLDSQELAYINAKRLRHAVVIAPLELA